MSISKYVLPVFFIAVSVIYFVLSVNLPKARLADPYGPLYFPIMISVCLFIASVTYLIQVARSDQEHENETSLLVKGRVPLLIISTIVITVIYTLIFESLGYLTSTVLFLGALLFIVNGRKKWIANVSVALLFTFAIWYSFTELLDINLP